MTDDVIEAILRTVRLGMYPDRAAQIHGIDPVAMRVHKSRHPEFVTALESAEAEAEQTLLGKIYRHMEKQWTAAAWMLERRWPERWAKRDPALTDSLQEIAAKLAQIHVEARHLDTAEGDEDAG